MFEIIFEKIHFIYFDRIVFHSAFYERATTMDCPYGFILHYELRIMHFALLLVYHKLAVVNLVVSAFLCQHLFMFALFCDSSLMHHQNLVCILDCAQSVGDHE